MSTSTMIALVQSTATDFGGAIVTVLGTVLGIAVAYLVFKFGWRKLRGAIR